MTRCAKDQNQTGFLECSTDEQVQSFFKQHLLTFYYLDQYVDENPDN